MLVGCEVQVQLRRCCGVRERGSKDARDAASSLAVSSACAEYVLSIFGSYHLPTAAYPRLTTRMLQRPVWRVEGVNYRWAMVPALPRIALLPRRRVRPRSRGTGGGRRGAGVWGRRDGVGDGSACGRDKAHGQQHEPETGHAGCSLAVGQWMRGESVSCDLAETEQREGSRRAGI